jgi:hypothetical protein
MRPDKVGKMAAEIRCGLLGGECDAPEVPSGAGVAPGKKE